MYKSKLKIKETQLAIQDLKFSFTKELYKKLNLTRVSAPLFLKTHTYINDALSGEEPVRFTPKKLNLQHDVVHSLAKWKRMALKSYCFEYGEGLWTDMNAIRKEEEIGYKHSYYVDQWDWELIIKKEDRNIRFLKKIANKIFSCIKQVEKKLITRYPVLKEKLPKKLFFISSKSLYNMYPGSTAEERERILAKEHKAIFIYAVGHNLPDGLPHSSRAFDYDDWNLNGDLIVWDEINQDALELSSMGIRIDKKALYRQSRILNKDNYWGLYHKFVADETVPFTIGGGIGQSRLSMFLLEKKHIGEVQVSSWSDEILEYCKREGIELL